MNRRFRIPDKERFRQVRQQGRSTAHPLLVLYFLPNDEPVSRCGFTVSRRVGNAVVRNRVRRRISEAVRSMWPMIEPGWDMIWIARTAIGKAKYVEVQRACVRTLQRAQLLQQQPESSILPSMEIERFSGQSGEVP